MIVQDREIEELQQAELRGSLLVQRANDSCAKQRFGGHRSYGYFWHHAPKTTPVGTVTVGTSTAFVPFRFQSALISNVVNSTAVFNSTTVTLTSAANFSEKSLVRFSDPQTRKTIVACRIVSISSNTLTLDRAVTLPGGAIVDSIYPEAANAGGITVRPYDSSSRIMINTPGVFEVEADLGFDYSSVLTGTVTLAVFKSVVSGETQGLVDIVTLPNAARNHRLHIAGILPLFPGDYLDMRVKKSSSTNANLKYSMIRLSVCQIAPGA